MDKLIARIKKVIVSPQDAFTEVKIESIVVTDFVKSYVAYLAAIPAIATFIGLVGRTGFFRNLIFSALQWVIGIVAVFVFAKIVEALANTFNSTKSDSNAFKLAAYSFTPGFVAGIFNINPSLSFLAFIGSLYGIYLVYLGLPILMDTPEEKRIAYTAVSIILCAIAMIILGSIAGLLAFGSLSGRYWY